MMLLGGGFALIASRLWSLDGRWFALVVAATTVIPIGAAVVLMAPGLLLPALFAAIPLAPIEKWFFFGQIPPAQAGNAMASGLIGVGPIDLILLTLAGVWLVRRFVHNIAPTRGLNGFDLLVLCVPLTYLISIVGTPRPILGLFAIAYLAKHIFVYFYVSRHFRHHHLQWWLLAVLFAIVFEGLLGLAQTQLDLLQGLARDKGAGSAERQAQYVVPGVEMRYRAEGSTYDSHAYGLYLATLLPWPILFLFDSAFRIRWRIGFAAVVVIGLIALVLSLSRSAWLSFAIAMTIGVLLLRFRVGIRSAGRVLLLALPVLLVLAPWAASLVAERFQSAPVEIMTTRYAQWEVALTIWLAHPLAGFGAGNYTEALATYNFNWAWPLPVHNVLLWVAAESGLLGVFAFFGVIVGAMARLFVVTGTTDRRSALAALAALIGLIAYSLDGLTNPLFREPAVYMMFWHLIAFAAILPHLVVRPSKTPIPSAWHTWFDRPDSQLPRSRRATTQQAAHSHPRPADARPAT